MKNLLFVLLLIPVFAFAQTDMPRYIEVEGEATRKVEPNFITADIVISSSEYYDTYNTKELSKFENAMRKAVSKLQLEPYLKHKNQFMGSCTSYEKEFSLEFTNEADYQKVRKLAEGANYDDLYVDFYLNDYKVSEDKIEEMQDELYVEALKNAQKKALLAGETLDFEVGDVILVQEQDSYYDDYYDSSYDSYYGEGTDLTPVVVAKTFYVRFEIID